jgi:predicted metal-binding protein
MQEILEQAVQGRAHEYAVIPTAAINFSRELLKACEANVCGNYNKCWTCPPAIGPMERQMEKITAFSSAFVFTTMARLEDSFDYEGMVKAKDYHNRLTAEMHERFGKTNPVYGAGGCTVCESCAHSEPCRFPDKAFLSIESAGINVTELSRSGNLRYNNGENTVTYFSMILFN